MRWVFFVSLIFTLLVTANREPQAAPWCAQDSSGSTNCGFYTYRQCEEHLSGMNGLCNRNPWEYAVADGPAYESEPYPAPYTRQARYHHPDARRSSAARWHTVRESRGWLIQRQARTGAWRAIPSHSGYRVVYRWSDGAWVPMAYASQRS